MDLYARSTTFGFMTHHRGTKWGQLIKAGAIRPETGGRATRPPPRDHLPGRRASPALPEPGFSQRTDTLTALERVR